MSRQMIVIAKDYAGEEYEFPDVYPVDGDSKSDCDRERAVALMGMLYHSYLETEEKESSIPIDHKRSYYSETEAYGQIAWENGDVHRYFLTGTQDIPGFEETGASKEDINAPSGADNPWSGQVLSLSTVHIIPDATDFLAVPRNSDAFQIFPNSDSCIMHVTNAEEALGYDIPLCVKDCIRYAWKNHYSWIYFGYEGSECHGLPTYRSAWDKI